MRYGTSGHWLDGREAPSTGGATYDVEDPGSGETLARAARGDGRDVQLAVASAARAYAGAWSEVGGRERAKLLQRLAQLIERDRRGIGLRLSLENGKPLAQADHEVNAAIRYCEYYSGWADRIDGRQIALPSGHLAVALREPLGVVALIIPWNYPLDILFRGLAPALAAGNAVIVKPAEDTPLSALAIARLTAEAGFPPGAVSVLTGFGTEVGAALASHPEIDGISFCGSVATGSRIAAAAAPNIVPVLSLELGGKCPSLVLRDADIAAAARAVARGLVYNAGQSCVARTRFYVPREALPGVEQIICQIMDEVRPGHCLADPTMGPLINRRQQERFVAGVAGARRDGARLISGGPVPSGLESGCFVMPHVFEATAGMAVACEEIFGPVLAVIPYDDEDEAIAMANASPYGLAAGLWAGDSARAVAAAHRLRASHVTINCHGGFGQEVPFGGIGKSGYGREGGVEGLFQYTRTKSLYMQAGWRPLAAPEPG